MSDIDAKTLDQFFKTAMQLAETGIQGAKILEAAKTGMVDTAQYRRDPAETMDARLRFYIVKEVYSVWNNEKREASLGEIFHAVNQSIAADISKGEWPRIWGHPSKRSVDRRTNETADSDHPEFWADSPFPHTVCVRPGHYRPNPHLFDEESRDLIAAAGNV